MPLAPCMMYSNASGCLSAMHGGHLRQRGMLHGRVTFCLITQATKAAAELAEPDQEEAEAGATPMEEDFEALAAEAEAELAALAAEAAAAAQGAGERGDAGIVMLPVSTRPPAIPEQPSVSSAACFTSCSDCRGVAASVKWVVLLCKASIYH